MKCTNCGNEVPKTANVCGNCGHALKAGVTMPIPQPDPQTVQSAGAGGALFGWIGIGVLLTIVVVAGGTYMLGLWPNQSTPEAPQTIIITATPDQVNVPPASTQTLRPASTSTLPNPSNADILFEDDFSDPDSGWPEATDADKSSGYVDGQYLIQAFTAKQDVWAHPGFDFSDVIVEVDAYYFSGTENNDFGIICRLVDDDNFYFLIASSDGYQAIGKYQDGELEYLSSDQMRLTDAVRQGSVANHLQADCIGSRLTLYINGQEVASVSDSSFESGDIGLTVGTFDDPNAAVAFDNFVARRP